MNQPPSVPAAKERQSGIELLRLLAGLAVIVLHFNFNPAGGGVLPSATGFSRVLLTVLETLCICAVNVFLLISGFFSCKAKEIRLRKLLLLLLQTVVLQLVLSAGSCLLSHEWSISKLLAALLPVNYYVVLYLSLMLLSPFLNKLIASLGTGAFRCLMLLLLGLFSVAATGVDLLKSIIGVPLAGLSPVGLDGSSGGYTFIHFLVMYCLGAWLKQGDLKSRPGAPLLGALLAVNVAALYLWRVVFPDTAWMYCNPLVISESCIVFLLFSRLSFHSKLINTLAPASFTCYLIHGALVARLPFEAVAAQNPIILLGILVLVLVSVYLLSFGVMLVWNLFARRLFTGQKMQQLAISAE